MPANCRSGFFVMAGNLSSSAISILAGPLETYHTDYLVLPLTFGNSHCVMSAFSISRATRTVYCKEACLSHLSLQMVSDLRLYSMRTHWSA